MQYFEELHIILSTYKLNNQLLDVEGWSGFVEVEAWSGLFAWGEVGVVEGPAG